MTEGSWRLGEALGYDWDPDSVDGQRLRGPVQIQDETLREGLQSPCVTDPGDDAKVDLLSHMEALGIEHLSVGIPAAGSHARHAAARLCQEIASHHWRIQPNAGGRTAAEDVRALCELAHGTGTAIGAFLFLGCSPIRQYVEDWSLDLLEERARESVGLATTEGLEVTFILEDATRSRPDHLDRLMATAVDAGACHVCLCDTVGAATPAATVSLVSWARERLDELDPGLGLDWHGHDDRGLALANALAAIVAGAGRIHATALGLGERAGNTATEQLLVNLRLLHLDDRDLTTLPRYTAATAAAAGVPIPPNAPIVGRDVFLTATGVHAAAVEKARAKGDAELADHVYCAVPASWVGRKQEIRVGPLSGAANVRACLRQLGVADDPITLDRVLTLAKRTRHTLSLEEIAGAVRGERSQDDEAIGTLW